MRFGILMENCGFVWSLREVQADVKPLSVFGTILRVPTAIGQVDTRTFVAGNGSGVWFGCGRLDVSDFWCTINSATKRRTLYPLGSYSSSEYLLEPIPTTILKITGDTEGVWFRFLEPNSVRTNWNRIKRHLDQSEIVEIINSGS